MKKSNRFRRNIPLVFFTFFITLSVALQVFASNPDKQPAEDKEVQAVEGHEVSAGSEKFEPGTFIMHHIGDAHEWHILSSGNFHLSVPLPVILLTENDGLISFCSSNFVGHGHGPKEYRGYILTENNHIIAADGSQVLDFSITKNVLAIFISMVFLCLIFLSVARAYTRRKDQAPRGLQNLMEVLILFIRDEVIRPAIGEKKYMKYLPFLMTVFFFIFLNNLLGLIPIIPGGANVTGNISVTLVLALFTFVITSFSGNRSYWQHIVNAPGVPWWLKIPIPLMPIIEILGMFTKPFVLMVRLFANISAGHIIALGFFSLIFIFGEMAAGIGFAVSPASIVFTVFMALLELLVAFIQAYVFTLLSAMYFGMAIEEHHKEAHTHEIEHH
ncbi:MAG: F0F1 ATP synthase subunit A [Bacteroidetes bacterium]|nr:F0F1 ATP synthase subunit A [Bacteroidota bacterium]MBU1720335.1 F0F1 ATP synthase subunit A [Bacteroidota bacterium]